MLGSETDDILHFCRTNCFPLQDSTLDNVTAAILLPDFTAGFSHGSSQHIEHYDRISLLEARIWMSLCAFVIDWRAFARRSFPMQSFRQRDRSSRGSMLLEEMMPSMLSRIV